MARRPISDAARSRERGRRRAWARRQSSSAWKQALGADLWCGKLYADEEWLTDCHDAYIVAADTYDALPGVQETGLCNYTVGMARSHIELQASDSDSDASPVGVPMSPQANVTFSLRFLQAYSAEAQSHPGPSIDDAEHEPGEMKQRVAYRVVPTTTSSISSGRSRYLPI